MKIKKNSSVRTIEAYAICQCVYALCACGSACECGTSSTLRAKAIANVAPSSKLTGNLVNGTV